MVLLMTILGLTTCLVHKYRTDVSPDAIMPNHPLGIAVVVFGFLSAAATGLGACVTYLAMTTVKDDYVRIKEFEIANIIVDGFVMSLYSIAFAVTVSLASVNSDVGTAVETALCCIYVAPGMLILVLFHLCIFIIIFYIPKIRAFFS